MRVLDCGASGFSLLRKIPGNAFRFRSGIWETTILCQPYLPGDCIAGVWNNEERRSMGERLKIKPMSELMGTAIPLPQTATAGSAGMDLRACLTEPVTVAPGQTVLIPSGIGIELPDSGFVALVFARSGLAIKHGLAMANGVGVIDSDYRGEIRVGVINQSQKAYTIEPGERIAQMLVMPVCRIDIELCHELGETERGSGGFGSTGRG